MAREDTRRTDVLYLYGIAPRHRHPELIRQGEVGAATPRENTVDWLQTRHSEREGSAPTLGTRANSGRPHGGAFLPGGLTFGNVGLTRFSEGNIVSLDARRYAKAKYHEAVRFLDRVLKPHAIPKTSAALRRLGCHSPPSPDDTLVFAARTATRLEQNFAATD
ncbi:hypothetical protein F4780DRAFT_782735 [Xylariomycetidae sp. FL0641]|nr:hypothetical protein F4780DRAFT_782735 [Xylariomycetidae sp. FL0641]